MEILSIVIHEHTPNLGGMNGDVQFELETLAFKNGEKLEDFHSIILRLQQEINIYGEIFSPTRLLSKYMKAFSNSDKIKAFIVPKIKNLITLLDNNRKSAIYTGGNIHELYFYL